MTPAPDLKDLLNRIMRVGALVSLVAGVLCLAGWYFWPERFYAAYMTAFLYFLGLGLGSMALAMIHGLTGGGWGLAIRRILEASFQTLPLMAVLFLPLLLGVHTIYEWAEPDYVNAHVTLARKAAYLNVPGFQIRALVCFGVWLSLAGLLSWFSPNKERDPESPRSQWLQRISGFGMVLYGLSATVAAVDWVMSLEPEWFSTMYGVLHIVGQAVLGLSFSIIVVVQLSRFEPWSRSLTHERLNNLGNMLLASTMFWTYCAFMQYLIIWLGNLPEENVWYIHRGHGGWQYVSLGLGLFHFVIPFFLLLSKRVKRSGESLIRVATLILVMRAVDLFWLVVPGFQHGSQRTGLEVSWMDPVAFLAIGGLWFAAFAWRLSSTMRQPLYDPAPQHGSQGDH